MCREIRPAHAQAAVSIPLTKAAYAGSAIQANIYAAKLADGELAEVGGIDACETDCMLLLR
jgi:hypothetical protein